MQALWAGALDILWRVLGRPETDPQMWGLFSGALLTLLIMLRVMAAAVNNANGGFLPNVLMVVLMVATMTAAAAAVRVFVFADTPDAPLSRTATLAAAAAALVLLVLPIMCLVQRIKYLTALISVLVAMAVSGLAVMGGQSLLDGRKGGQAVSEKVDEHHRALKKVFDE
jgi:hypothetical protein